MKRNTSQRLQARQDGESVLPHELQLCFVQRSAYQESKDLILSDGWSMLVIFEELLTWNDRLSLLDDFLDVEHAKKLNRVPGQDHLDAGLENVDTVGGVSLVFVVLVLKVPSYFVDPRKSSPFRPRDEADAIDQIDQLRGRVVFHVFRSHYRRQLVLLRRLPSDIDAGHNHLLAKVVDRRIKYP